MGRISQNEQLFHYQQTSWMRTHFHKLFLLYSALSYWQPSEHSPLGICSHNPSWTQDLSAPLLGGCFSLSLNITNLINLKARIEKTKYPPGATAPHKHICGGYPWGTDNPSETNRCDLQVTMAQIWHERWKDWQLRAQSCLCICWYVMQSHGGVTLRHFLSYVGSCGKSIIMA